MEGNVRAPFNEEQVASLNGYQLASLGPPYTCIICREKAQQELQEQYPDHPEKWRLQDPYVMIARSEGLECPRCGLLQVTAHTHTTDWSWKPDTQAKQSRDERIIELFDDAVRLLGGINQLRSRSATTEEQKALRDAASAACSARDILLKLIPRSYWEHPSRLDYYLNPLSQEELLAIAWPKQKDPGNPE